MTVKQVSLRIDQLYNQYTGYNLCKEITRVGIGGQPTSLQRLPRIKSSEPTVRLFWFLRVTGLGFTVSSSFRNTVVIPVARTSGAEIRAQNPLVLDAGTNELNSEGASVRCKDARATIEEPHISRLTEKKYATEIAMRGRGNAITPRRIG